MALMILSGFVHILIPCQAVTNFEPSGLNAACTSSGRGERYDLVGQYKNASKSCVITIDLYFADLCRIGPSEPRRPLPG